MANYEKIFRAEIEQFSIKAMIVIIFAAKYTKHQDFYQLHKKKKVFFFFVMKIPVRNEGKKMERNGAERSGKVKGND